jgi:hypothetical protein
MRTALVISLVLCFISFLFMFLYFLASTDIYHDYVGYGAIVKENINADKLSVWTKCIDEWELLRIDFIIRTIFMSFTTIVLIILLDEYKKQPRHNKKSEHIKEMT